MAKQQNQRKYTSRFVMRNPETGRFEDMQGRPIPPPVVIHGEDGHVLSADEIEHLDRNERCRRLTSLLESWLQESGNEPAERHDWEEIKQGLNENRMSNRKLFP